ncbi:MAG: type II toxin-antitoxin system HicB family antitoxin [Deltaproteobacteria bacterium]|nr:type II toxin-antitoxin system HicB family antitoxin [Deltaproteobacteria bacterium]
MKRQYSVVYETIEDGWIMATVPELPGAVTQGRNLDEAREMIIEAVELLLRSYRNPTNGRCAPVPRHNEIKDTLCRVICDQLGIPRPG